LGNSVERCYKYRTSDNSPVLLTLVCRVWWEELILCPPPYLSLSLCCIFKTTFWRLGYVSLFKSRITQLIPIDRANPYLWRQMPTQDSMYKHSINHQRELRQKLKHSTYTWSLAPLAMHNLTARVLSKYKKKY
jgi:hypothetical protein